MTSTWAVATAPGLATVFTRVCSSTFLEFMKPRCIIPTDIQSLPFGYRYDSCSKLVVVIVVKHS